MACWKVTRSVGGGACAENGDDSNKITTIVTRNQPRQVRASRAAQA